MSSERIQETVTISSENAGLEIKINDFREAPKLISNQFSFMHTHTNSKFIFHVDVSPGEDAEDWIELNTLITDHEGKVFHRNSISLHCVASIIDSEGNSRYPVSLEFVPPEKFSTNATEILRAAKLLKSSSLAAFKKVQPVPVAKYLKKSFILNRAEELLPDLVLTLRVDFHFNLEKFASLCHEFSRTEVIGTISSCCTLNREIINEVEIGDRNDITTEDGSDILIVFDYTDRILTLPQFHQTRRRFGVYGIPPESPSANSNSEKDNVEDIWMFDVEGGRILLSFDESNSAGFRLLRSSPVIRRMINTPMKEQREKRIKFSKLEIHPFFLVLEFLRLGKFSGREFDDLLKVYKFFHQYEMEYQQQKCAEYLATNFELENQLEELERTAYHYNDQYLSKLLNLDQPEYENLDETLFGYDEIPYSECYV